VVDPLTSAERDAVEAMLDDMLAPDGYAARVLAWPDPEQRCLRLEVTALPGACAECLVSKDILSAVLASSFPGQWQSADVQLIYPDDD
jgi:hypothetical protein